MSCEWLKCSFSLTTQHVVLVQISHNITHTSLPLIKSLNCNSNTVGITQVDYV